MKADAKYNPESWNPLEYLKEHFDEYLEINIDTRDFWYFGHKKTNIHSKLTPEKIDLINNNKSDYVYSKDELYCVLKEIKEYTGGEKSWRAIYLNEYPRLFCVQNWFKYIRIFKFAENQYVVYDSTNPKHEIVFLPKRLLTKENIVSN